MPTFRDSPAKKCSLLVQPLIPCSLSISVLHRLKCPCRQHALLLLWARWMCEDKAKLVGETASRNIPRCCLMQLDWPLACSYPTQPAPCPTAPGIVSESQCPTDQCDVASTLQQQGPPSRGMSCSLPAGLSAWKCSPVCFIYYDNQSGWMRVGDPALGTSILPV